MALRIKASAPDKVVLLSFLSFGSRCRLKVHCAPEKVVSRCWFKV